MRLVFKIAKICVQMQENNKQLKVCSKDHLQIVAKAEEWVTYYLITKGWFYTGAALKVLEMAKSLLKSECIVHISHFLSYIPLL